MAIEVNCNRCNKSMMRYPCEINKTGEYWCSRKCRYPDNEKRIVNCLKCNKEFEKVNAECVKTKNNFCSRSCSASYNNTHKTYGTRRSKLEIYLEEQIREHYPHLELICNQKTAIESELDFYFPQLRFAVELNGITHYEPIYGEDKFEKIQNNDKRKVIACYEKDIELAIIDSSTCTYLNESAKNKFKNLVFGLLDKVKNRKPSLI
jgi:very-short-patch-repair endonuclease